MADLFQRGFEQMTFPPGMSYNLGNGGRIESRFLDMLIGWVPLIDIQRLREFRFLVLFGLWMFLIHHLYKAILISIEEETGLIESIFGGTNSFRKITSLSWMAGMRYYRNARSQQRRDSLLSRI